MGGITDDILCRGAPLEHLARACRSQRLHAYAFEIPGETKDVIGLCLLSDYGSTLKEPQGPRWRSLAAASGLTPTARMMLMAPGNAFAPRFAAHVSGVTTSVLHVCADGSSNGDSAYLWTLQDLVECSCLIPTKERFHFIAHANGEHTLSVIDRDDPMLGWSVGPLLRSFLPNALPDSALENIHEFAIDNALNYDEPF